MDKKRGCYNDATGADEEDNLDHDGDDEGDDEDEMFEVYLSGKEYCI